MSQHPSEGSDGLETSQISSDEKTEPQQAPTFLRPGQALGDYRIVARLGVGGMGEVYEAVDGRTQETVALKVMKWRNPAREIRFKREFRVLAEVRHENLVRPRELIATDEYFFFTMDLCEGPNLVRHVRHEVSPGQLPNLTRLRRALRQLVAGVSALHAKGLLHRDLKPSNVLVTHHGLVRILDFGLVRDVNVSVDITAEGQMLGTPAYMAPEQAAATPATQASDWYAVGTMLYELLTGERPFTGSLVEVITSKSDRTPPDPRDKIASVPDDLARLSMSLMRVDPKARPGPEEILDVLGVDAAADTATGLCMDHQPLVGRDAELAALRAAFERVRMDGQSVTVHLQAESGMGKSKLISEFLATSSPSYPPFILRGRCFERESVPYKGLDGVIDSLSSQLRHLDELETAAILPRDVTSLSRLFPVFTQIPAVANRRRRAAAGLDPQEARQRGVAALRELLARLGDRRPLIVIIDDFQWADPDSARLLNELMTEPDGPALFLIVAFRPEVDSRAALAALTSPTATSMRDIEVLELAPLRDEDVVTLAKHLLGETNRQVIDQVLSRARGNPFYIGELVRGGEPEQSSAQLDELVARRIRRLDPTSRRLLEIIAVAAGPIPLETVSQAAGDDHVDITRSFVTTLHRDDLVQIEDDGWVECAHDRIRETAVSDMAPSRLRSQHLQLGQLLESEAGHFESLLEHFEQGGDSVRAAHYAEEAAAVAYATFAFDRTVELLQRSLLLVPDPEPEALTRRRRLLADALNDVGRGQEAAPLWLDMAEHLPREEGRLLKRRAAESLIKTGHVEDGLSVLDSLLEAFDLSLPRTRSRALAALMWERGRVAVRGRRFRPTPASRLPAEQLELIDLCFAVVCGLSTQEVLMGALFQARNFRLSLDAGEPYRAARAIAYQAVVSVHLGGRWLNAEQDWRRAKDLADKIEDPKLTGYVDLCECAGLWLERRWPEASLKFLDLLERLDGIPDTSWERNTSEEFMDWVLIQQGDFSGARARLLPARQRARDCGDLHFSIDLSAMIAITQFVSGDLDGSQQTLDEATTGWAPDRYLFTHVWLFYARAPLALLRGDVETALRLCEETLHAMGPSSLDQLAFIRDSVREIEARTHLLAALGGDREKAAIATKRARDLRKTQNPVLMAHADIIDAGLALMREDTSTAIEQWQRARSTFATYGMQAQCASIDLQTARLSGEDTTVTIPEYFEQQHIDAPMTFANVLVPAFPR